MWELDLAIYALKKAQGSSTTGKMFKRISNFQIEFAIKNLSGNDIKENFVG